MKLFKTKKKTISKKDIENVELGQAASQYYFWLNCQR